MQKGIFLQISFAFTICGSFSLGIIALALNDTFAAPSPTAREQCYSATNILGVISLATAFIIYLCVIILKKDGNRRLIITVFLLGCIGLLFYAIACGCYFSSNPPLGAWLFSALWIAVGVVGIGLDFLFINPLDIRNGSRFKAETL
ncbi:unnamed protein product [Dicrocoelium dendriticum]|nr:unnamed protein product [Dicrocoelium dendriticum]